MKLIQKNDGSEEKETKFDDGDGGGGGGYETKMVENSYYVITHPDLPGYCIKNFGDREFRLHRPMYNGYAIRTVEYNGNDKWEITEEHIHGGAEFLLKEEIKKIKKEKQKQLTLKKQTEEKRNKSFWRRWFN